LEFPIIEVAGKQVPDDVAYIAHCAAYAAVSGQLADLAPSDFHGAVIAAGHGKMLVGGGVVSESELESALWKILRHEQVEGDRYMRQQIIRQAVAEPDCAN
jgi:hypothetical protein